ncbi:polysaccharide biosynthesis tyrosine autokinase [Echinicola sp. CAU 1574]|uniref:non-specific protein-tyrosine kinase n=1 Tax=Echinicola arenosa TaxID=2774144 RepID=A0ABR9ANX0_9BACT|nr:tyrosine-protein kinase [Echinicola arenosa]MBD8490486.1 polysaccharide biosynthesis tyrosine autokinase [Echinicola arenosa]
MNNNTEFEYYTEDNSNNLDIKEFLGKYLKFWPYIVASVLLAVTGAYFYNLTNPSEYKVEGRLMIEAETSGNVLDLTGNVPVSGIPLSNRIFNQINILKSRPLANEVLDKLDFDVEYYELGTFQNKEVYEESALQVVVDWEHTQLTESDFEISWNNNKSFSVNFPEGEYKKFNPDKSRSLLYEHPGFGPKSFSFDQWVELPFARFKVSVPQTESGDYLVQFRDRTSLVNQYVGDNYTVAQVNALSSILSIELVTTVPEKGRRYINELMATFLDNGLKEKNLQASKTVDFIDNQISGVSDSLSFIENKLERFRSNNRTYNIGSEGNTIFTKITELETVLSQERFKKQYYEQLQDYLVRESYDNIILPSGIGIEDPILNRLIEDLILLQSERSQYLTTQSNSSPSVIAVTKKISDLNESIKEVLRNVNKNSEMTVSDLERRLAKTESEFSRLPVTEQNLLRIQRSFTLNENIYTFLMQRRAESAIAMVSNSAPDKIIENAVPIFVPLKLKPLTNYILATALGFLIPIIIISIIIFTNVRIKDRKELEKKLTAPLLTSIGHNKTDKSLVVFNRNKSGIAEAFRALRTNITFIVPKDKHLTIAISSTIAGEGKTFTSMNLASAYSISDKKTILIGCDLHKPKIFDDFKLTNNLGLSTYLSNQVDNIDAVIQKTSFPNLDVVLAGPTPPNPAELLVKPRFEEMLLELKKSYDVIVLDTPPLGLTSETLSILRQVDLTLCVLRYNYSKFSFIEDINFLRESKGLKNIYAVFNDVSTKSLNYGGYGYGYYSDDKKSNVLDKVFKGSGRAAV